MQECSRLDIGYITFSDPANYDTFDIRSDPGLGEPDPSEVDKFIKTQISLEYQEELQEWLS